VTLAGLVNALKVVEKPIDKVRIVMLGAGASNTTIARLIIKAGADAGKMVIFDTKGPLSKKRADIKADPRFYRKWELCQTTNEKGFETMEAACKGADVYIALSTPGPGVVKPEWIKAMAPKAIVFACANPVPEIYPYEAKEAGAYVVATGRGDFENQVNNSLGFPGILKGALLVRARKVTDDMAVAAAYSIAKGAEKDLSPDYIVPKMDNATVFPRLATDVAMQAIKDGVARVKLTEKELYAKAKKDIDEARDTIHHMMEAKLIKEPPAKYIDEALAKAIQALTAAPPAKKK
jgi:malate dehydrogenase (oxaloacetate-decarboxylating)